MTYVGPVKPIHYTFQQVHGRYVLGKCMAISLVLPHITHRHICSRADLWEDELVPQYVLYCQVTSDLFGREKYWKAGACSSRSTIPSNGALPNRPCSTALPDHLHSPSLIYIIFPQHSLGNNLAPEHVISQHLFPSGFTTDSILNSTTQWPSSR